MPESIDTVKDRLRQSFLGNAGVHGVGLSRTEQAIRVYISSNADSGQADLLEQLRKSAVPFRVIVVEEESPRITS